jgi:hypothetical protein
VEHESKRPIAGQGLLNEPHALGQERLLFSPVFRTAGEQANCFDLMVLSG